MIFQPHDYQKYCIERILNDKALGLFLDMGLGKTAITLTALNELRFNRFEIGKTLVIAPKKVAEDTWTREKEKWDHLYNLRVVSCLGSEAKRIRAINTPGDIFVINRENVVWLVEHYRNSWPFQTVVIDEMSSFKSSKAKRFKAMKAIRPHIDRIIGLTGTPTPKGLEDLWSQVYLLDSGERLGKTISQYRNRYFNIKMWGPGQVRGYDPKAGSDQSIHESIKDICISLKAEDYLNLPDLIEDIRYIKLDNKAEKQYLTFEKQLYLEIDEEQLDAGSAAVLSGKLLQFCNGAVYNADGDYIEVHDSKLEAFMEMIEELDGKPVLVFYNFKHDKERIQKALKKAGIECRDLANSKDIEDWNNQKIPVALAHPASTAYGLNLQDGGNHLIWFGLNWSLELYQQAIKRLHRQGQTQKVFNHILVIEGKRDIDVLEALTTKDEVQEKLLQSLKARIKEIKYEHR